MSKFNRLYENIMGINEQKDTLSSAHIKTIKGLKWKSIKPKAFIYEFEADDGEKSLQVYEKSKGNDNPFVITYSDNIEQDYGFKTFATMDDLKAFAKSKLNLSIK